MIAVETQLDVQVHKTPKSRLPDVDFTKLAFGGTFADHMFVADCVEGQWQDLKLMPYGDLQMSPALSALHYGQTIFEGMKAYRAVDGRVSLFRPLDHLARLNRSAERLCMEPIPRDVFMSGLTTLLKTDADWVPKDGSLYIRPIYFASDDQLGVHASRSYRLVIFTCPVTSYYSSPLLVQVETNHVRAADGGIGYVKTAGNYARSLSASQKARAEGFNVVLWLDALNRKYIEEYSTMNAFFVIDGVTVTPPTSGTILEGITRESAIHLLKDAGYKVSQRDISIDEVIESGKEGRLTEAFGTGTAAVGAPVQSIHYQGDSVSLPGDPANWPTLSYLLKTLSGIRSLSAADPYGWMLTL